MKVTLDLFLHHHDCYGQDGPWRLYGCDMSKHNMGVFVQQVAVTFDAPDNFNPIPGRVAALENQKRQLKAVFAKSLMEIEDSISKLTCLTNEVSQPA